MTTPMEGVFINKRLMAVYRVKIGDLFLLRGGGNEAVVRVEDIQKTSSALIGDNIRFVLVSGTCPPGAVQDDVSIEPIPPSV